MDDNVTEDARDRFGVVHTCEPGRPKHGNACYGDLQLPAFACGCRPLIHRFKCAARPRIRMRKRNESCSSPSAIS